MDFTINRTVNEYTIVVPDSALLSCVCGTNDDNLKLIEEHLGLPVFTKGNEISVDTDDSEKRQKFRFIIDRLIDEINSGEKNPFDIIASVLNVQKNTCVESVSVFANGFTRKVYPRTQNQADYILSMRKSDLVFCYGAAGSGKTFLAVAEALRLVLSHKKKKLVLSRPIVEAGESLGYLPGVLEEKINPYLRPLFDSMEMLVPKESIARLLDAGIIETAPLAYMRGRTLRESVMILDEAQNATKEQMKMFLTRMGEDSKIFVTGDITQIDLPNKNHSGLVHSMNLLSGLDEVGMNRLTAEDVARNPLVKKIVRAYENEKEQF